MNKHSLTWIVVGLATALVAGCSQNGQEVARGMPTLPALPTLPGTPGMAPAALAAPVLAAPVATLGGTDAQQFQRSYDDEAAGKLDVALADLDGLGASGTAGYVAQLRRGWLLYRLGKHADAVTAYARASERDPSSTEAKVGALLPLGELRRWVDVELKAKEILQRDPGNATANLRLAFALYSQARYGEAEAAYRVVLGHAPSDVDARAGLGWSQLKAGKAKEAQATFAEILGYAPRNALALDGMKALGAKG